MSVKSIPIFTSNLIFAENLIFGRQKRPFWTPVALKRDMKLYAHSFVSTLRIFYVKMATSEEHGVGWGSAYHSCDRAWTLFIFWKHFVHEFIHLAEEKKLDTACFWTEDPSFTG